MKNNINRKNRKQVHGYNFVVNKRGVTAKLQCSAIRNIKWELKRMIRVGTVKIKESLI